MGSATSDTSVRDGGSGTHARVQCSQDACDSSADFCCTDAGSYICGPRPKDKGVCGLGEKSHPLILARTAAGFECNEDFSKVIILSDYDHRVGLSCAENAFHGSRLRDKVCPA